MSTNNDVFKEQLVERKPQSADMIKKAGIIIGALASIVLLSMVQFLAAFLMPIVVVEAFLIFMVLRRFNVEYEYILTNGELDIDKIMNKQKRKKVLSVDVKSFETMVSVKSGAYAGEVSQFNKLIDVSSGVVNEQTYAALFTKDNQVVKLVFEPNEMLLKAIKGYIPRKVKA